MQQPRSLAAWTLVVLFALHSAAAAEGDGGYREILDGAYAADEPGATAREHRGEARWPAGQPPQPTPTPPTSRSRQREPRGLWAHAGQPCHTPGSGRNGRILPPAAEAE